jgi:hypothetical protein
MTELAKIEHLIDAFEKGAKRGAKKVRSRLSASARIFVYGGDGLAGTRCLKLGFDEIHEISREAFVFQVVFEIETTIFDVFLPVKDRKYLFYLHAAPTDTWNPTEHMEKEFNRSLAGYATGVPKARSNGT